MTDIMDVDLSKATRIAFGSSRLEDADRWTEIAVYFQPRGWPRFCTEIIGRSVLDGERDRVRRLAGGRLERALKLIDESSQFGVMVAEQAREWEETNRAAIKRSLDPLEADGTFEGTTLEEALFWLYDGQPDPGRRGFVGQAADDLGISKRSIERALAAEEAAKSMVHKPEPPRLMVPLMPLLPFLDRGRFLAWRDRKRRAAAE